MDSIYHIVHNKEKIDCATADARCMIEIGIQGKATTTSWYEIWEAVIAIVAMCVRAEKGGKAYRIGQNFDSAPIPE